MLIYKVFCFPRIRPNMKLYVNYSVLLWNPKKQCITLSFMSGGGMKEDRGNKFFINAWETQILWFLWIPVLCMWMNMVEVLFWRVTSIIGDHGFIQTLMLSQQLLQLRLLFSSSLVAQRTSEAEKLHRVDRDPTKHHLYQAQQSWTQRHFYLVSWNSETKVGYL